MVEFKMCMADMLYNDSTQYSLYCKLCNVILDTE